jgi:hypothetical protein
MRPKFKAETVEAGGAALHIYATFLNLHLTSQKMAEVVRA